MKKFACALVLLAAGSNACAVEPSPVLLVVLDDMGAKNQAANGSAGLLVVGIGAWANHSVNKQSARKVQSFMRVLGTPDFLERSQAAFGCFATSQPCAARPAYADSNQFLEAVRAVPSQDGYVVELLPELAAEQLVIRAKAYRVEASDDGSPIPVKVDRAFHALYTTRAPASLTTLKKSKLTALEAYWSEGEPRRIVSVTSRGLAEMNALFGILIRQEGGGPGEVTMNLNQFPDKKRLSCKGAALCGMTYLWKDNGDSFVFVYNGNYAGWYDAEAAAFESNMPGLAQWGPPGPMLPAAP